MGMWPPRHVSFELALEHRSVEEDPYLSVSVFLVTSAFRRRGASRVVFRNANTITSRTQSCRCQQYNTYMDSYTLTLAHS